MAKVVLDFDRLRRRFFEIAREREVDDDTISALAGPVNLLEMGCGRLNCLGDLVEECIDHLELLGYHVIEPNGEVDCGHPF